MAEIPARLVMELRAATGAGMMDAKRALQETDGDVEAATDLLRKKGMASAAKRAERGTPEGEVLTAVSGSVGAIAAVGCETEPVSKNEDFLAFAEQVLETVAGGGDPSSLEEERMALSGRLGENIQVVGAARLQAADGETLAEYVHPPARKKGVLVQVRGGNAPLARQLAMHISFAAPRYLHRDGVPQADVDHERSVLEGSEDVASKPENVRGKIVSGRLDKWFAETVLVDQTWIHDTSLTVAKALQQGGLEVVDFRHYSLG